MEKDETMLALEDDLGSIFMSQHITPGIYYVSATMGDEAIPYEYYIAERECIELSQDAKRYGQPLENHPEYLCYPAGSPDNGRMVIEYEANRYLKKHGLPSRPLDPSNLLILQPIYSCYPLFCRSWCWILYSCRLH